ncbi:hypothetical protein [Pasteuria penetrans]|uniref:hypothetical protein n=1 Tax=Pasteuria penetrans TaxID=86005 RepID=UPI0011EEA771|nr:hypothetical protein [Pasteuria penetrans]
MTSWGLCFVRIRPVTRVGKRRSLGYKAISRKSGKKMAKRGKGSKGTCGARYGTTREVAERSHPVGKGWVNYYGVFDSS